MYDVNDHKSLDHCRQCKRAVKEATLLPNGDPVPIVLIANKVLLYIRGSVYTASTKCFAIAYVTQCRYLCMLYFSLQIDHGHSGQHCVDQVSDQYNFTK